MSPAVPPLISTVESFSADALIATALVIAVAVIGAESRFTKLPSSRVASIVAVVLAIE